MVKNEQDVIEPFIRHNHKFFDAMIVLDNRSVDDTRRILRACARELGKIIVTDLPDASYRQSEFMTAALHHVQSAFFADFVCFLDADEFITAPDRETFLRLIDRVPTGRCVKLPWQTYLPERAASPDEPIDPLARMRWRRKAECPAFSKVFIRMGGGFDPRLVVRQGNHAIGRGRSRDFRTVEIPGLRLMHFPLRSVPQMITKGVVGWKGSLAFNPRSAELGIAFQWMRIAKLVESGEIGQNPTALSDEAMVYAQSEAPADWHDNAEPASSGISLERRYSDGRYGDPDRIIAASAVPTDAGNVQIDLPRPVAAQPGEKGGITNSFHDRWHREHVFVDVAPLRYLAEKYAPETVLDIGCGNGTNLHLMKHFGARRVLGWDGIAQTATVLAADEYARVDLQQQQDAGESYDLVMCLEVVEHVDPQDTATILDTIARHARDLIVFSMAEPGQPGNGHINCRTMAEVLALWQERGWVPDLTDSLGVRALASLSWFRRNLIVLKRATAMPAAEAENAIAALSQIGSYSFEWYRQEPGIRAAAFKEPLPRTFLGYPPSRGT